MKLFLKSILTLALLFIVGCGDSVEQVGYADGKTKGNVIFVFQKNSDGSLVDSVKVTLITNKTDKEEFSDSTGQAVFEDLEIGSHAFLIEKKGFASMWYYASIELQNNESEVPIAFDETNIIPLVGTEAGVKGLIRKVDADNNQTVAGEVRVQLTVGSLGGGLVFRDRIMETTTGEDGTYSFSDLPEDVYYTVEVFQKSEGDQVYSTSSTASTSGVVDGQVDEMNTLVMSLEARSMGVISTNFQELSESDTLKIKLSEKIDASKIEIDDIRVTSGQNIAVDYTISEDGLTLSVTPFGGKWDVTKSYSIALSLQSVDGATTSWNGIFNVVQGDKLGDVEGIVFDGDGLKSVSESTSSVEIAWDELEGATSYEVYAKSYMDSTFTLRGTVTDKEYDLYTYLWFEDGKSAEFFVVGKNDKYRSPISSADVQTMEP